MPEGYDIAQVCPNGHVANSSSVNFPQANKAHCDRGGEKTITACPGCQQSIRGAYWGSGSLLKKYVPPAYCIGCGRPFPWTERQLQAAYELFADEVTPEEAKDFEDNLQNVVK